jgi:hypothetical protein
MRDRHQAMRDMMWELGERGTWRQKLIVIVEATSPPMISRTLMVDVNGTPNNPISLATRTVSRPALTSRDRRMATRNQ